MIHVLQRARAFAALAILAIGACNGDSVPPAKGVAKASSAVPRTQQQANGDVVIRGNGADYRVAAVATPGTVSGTVTLKNAPASGATIATGAFGPVCGATVLDESIQLTGNSLGGVVVWIDGIHEGKALPDERRLELESVQCKLHPRIQAALTGSAVNIIGHDEFRQHLSFIARGDSAKRATVLVGGGEQVIPTELPFRAPGLVLVRDPEHSWTRAYLAVFDHPYFAVSAANGTFSVEGVPPGKHTLHAWHERTGETTQQIDVTANGTVKLALELTVK